MGSPDSRVFEVVILASAFRDPRGRSAIVEFFPQSVVDLYDIVVAHPDWHETDTLAQKALLVARVLQEDESLAARYQADVDAGLMGFGAGEDEEMDAAIREVGDTLNPTFEMAPPPDDGLLGGGPTEGWAPDLPMAEPPAEMAEPPADGRTTTAMAEPPAPPPAVDAPPLAPVSAGPPSADVPSADQAEEGDAVQTWLNVQLDDWDGPLAVAIPYTLAVFFGEKSAAAQAAAPTTTAHPRGLRESSTSR